jgi:hypothetical protein
VSTRLLPAIDVIAPTALDCGSAVCPMACDQPNEMQLTIRHVNINVLIEVLCNPVVRTAD